MKNNQYFSPPYAGIPTFAKMPFLDINKMKEDKQYIGFFGIPYDMGTTDIPGARLGPRYIRLASTRFAYTKSNDLSGMTDQNRIFYDIELNKQIFQDKKYADFGDVEIITGNPKQSFLNITETIQNALQHKIIPICFGGDHAITSPILTAYHSMSDIVIFHLDAHMDYWNAQRNSEFDHSCSIFLASKMPQISNIFQFGIRGLNHPMSMRKDASQQKITTYTALELIEQYQNIINSIPTDKKVYISLDVDFFDPSTAPRTSTPEEGGFDYRFAKKLLQDITKKNTIIGADIVEVNPIIDESQRTSSLAARLSLDIVNMMT